MYKTIELAFTVHLNKKTQSYLKDSLERILTSKIGFKFSFTSIKYNPKIFLDKCYRGRVFRLVLAESSIQMDHAATSNILFPNCTFVYKVSF